MSKTMDQAPQADKSQRSRQDNVHQSIANVTEAVQAIVSRSTDEEFRQTCFSLMEVSDSAGLATHLSDQLQSLAHQHMGIRRTTEATEELSTMTTPPTAPVTPSQNADPSLDPSQPRSTNDTTINDDFSEFTDVDFFDDGEVSGPSVTFQPEPPREGAVHGGVSDAGPSESLKVLETATEDDWFDKVLDSELFVNEN